MAATQAIAIGFDKSGRQKESSRLGSESARANANTWRTFTTCQVRANGSGFVEVRRDGVVIHSYEFGPEECGGVK